MSAHSFDEFLNIYNTYFTNDTIVAYDIETTARPIFMEGSEIIGFSIGNKKNGVYACLKSLDFEMPKEDIDKIWEFTKSNIFDKKILIIHNTMYERPYTLYCLNYEIKFEQADDTLVMARMLKNPKESAGLKYQAQNYLGYPDWETDLTRYIENFIAFYNRVAIGPKKFEKLWNDIYHTKTSIFKLKELDTFTALKYADQLEIDSIVNNLKSVLVDLYNEEEIIHIGKLITNKIIEVYNQGGIKDSTIPYNWIPDRVLSKYGAIDSISTFDLRDYFMDIMDKESTDKVDLHKGYENWLEHMYVAYIMERNGMYWNEELVKRDEKFLNDQALKSLKVMLKSPLFQPYIRRVCENKYKPILLSDYFPEIAESQGYRVDYDRTTDKYTIFYNGKRVAKAYLDSIDVNANVAYRKPYEDTLYDLFNEDVEKATHWEDLKDLYNPSSSNYNWVPRAILMTPRVQIGAKINKLDVLSTGELESKKGSFPAIDKKFLDIAELLCNHELEEGGKFTLPEKYGDNWAEKRKELYDGFCLLFQNYRNQVTVPEIKAVLKEKESLEIESFDDNGMIAIYNAQVVDGIDPDNPDTYDEEFKWMINFRLFKKTQKLITSYINGSVGRESVTIVDKNELSSGNTRLTRKRKYFDTDGKISEDETYLLASKWMPNTAETGRWRSAIHTLPWSSPIKRYYSSRFNGGTIICPDYSQMEVRSLAAISKDKNMLELFSSGKDFHRETACFTGDTKVCLMDGTRPTFEELVKRYPNPDETFWVYSVDDHNNITCGLARYPRITKQSEVVEVLLDNGSTIRCTKEHLFRTRNGYVKAENLKVGESITPLYTKYDDKGYQLYYDLVNKEFKYTHHMSAEINEPNISFSGMVRHHIDFNKKNNSPDNLVKMKYADHIILHTQNYEQGLGRYIQNLSIEEKQQIRKKAIETRKRNGSSEKDRKAKASRGKKFLSRDGAFLNDPKYEEIRRIRTKKAGESSHKTWMSKTQAEKETFRKMISQAIRKAKAEEPFEITSERLKKSAHKRLVRGWLVRYNNMFSDPSRSNQDKFIRNVVQKIKEYSEIYLYTYDQIFEEFPSLKTEKVINDLYYNHKVISVTPLEGVFKVYDLTVDTYHNFAVDTSKENQESAIFVHNCKIYQKEEVTDAERRFSKAATFSLLYGSTVSSFANKYCKGDMTLANKIYGGFFKAYPEVEDWVEKRHEEVKKDHRVSLELSGRFIRIEPEGNDNGAIAAMLRKAQNYPIQATSADLTGCVVYDLQKFIEDRHMKSLIFMYVHDSIEADIYPYEMIEFIDYLKVLLNEAPKRRMGLISKADVALGKSLGHEIGLKELEHNEDYTDCVMTLKGFKDEIYETVENWKLAYKTVEIYDEEWEEYFVSVRELFIAKKAYTPTIGTMRYKGTCKVHINYYK